MQQGPRKLKFPFPLLGKWREAYYSPARFKVLYAARGVGKSTTLMAMAIEAAFRGWSVLYIAPTWSQAKDIFFVPLLAMLSGTRALGEVNRSEMTMRVGRGLIQCRSGERPDNIRGRHHFKRILVDETQKAHPDLWDAVISPMLNVTRAEVVFAGTPMGPVTKLHEFFTLAQSGQPDWAAWHLTHKDAQHLDQAGIEARRLQAEAAGPTAMKLWRQENLADWTQFKGKIFERWDPDRMVVREIPSRFQRMVAGMDWGFSESHAGVFLVCGQDAENRWWVVDEDVNHDGTIEGYWLPLAREKAKTWALKHDDAQLWLPNDRKDGIRAFRHATDGKGACGWTVRDAMRDPGTVWTGIVTLSTLIDQDKLRVHARCDTLRRQLPSYRWEEAKDGHMLEKPHKAFDDSVDALRYALHSEASRPQPSYA